MAATVPGLKNKLLAFWRKHRRALCCLGGVLLLVYPFAVNNDYIRGVSTKILLYMLITSSMNAINGYSGQFTIGHAGFLCIGAYTAAILMTKLGISFWLSLPAAGLMAALFGLLISFPTSKLSGLYLTIVTVGFSEIVRFICLNWNSVTNGPMGIKAIPAPAVFSISLKSSQAMYYIILVLVVLMAFCTSRIIRSRVGRAWIAIRENQQAAASLGIEVFRYKAVNFMYGAFWAGVAGAFMAIYYQYIDSTMFTIDECFNILSMAVVGGLGTIAGPLVGAFLVNIITEALRFLSEFRMVIYAVLIIGTMWIRPHGIAGASDSVMAMEKSKKQRRKKAGAVL